MRSAALGGRRHGKSKNKAPARRPQHLLRSISTTFQRHIESLLPPAQYPRQCPDLVAQESNRRRSAQVRRREESSRENPSCRTPLPPYAGAFDRETRRDRGSPPASPVPTAGSPRARSESSDA